MRNKNRRGQVTIFIIIAVILVASVALFFIIKGSIKVGGLPSNMQAIYTDFLNCLEEETLTGVSILESQGGYIELPDFEPGSSYMPFSSQLNFLGNPVPYWYYISGNGIAKEQVPAKKEMETQLESFVEDRIRGCVFQQYYEQGFEIEQGEPSASITIRDNEIAVNLKMNLNIRKEDETAFISSHSIRAESVLGSLYNSAKRVYNYEQTSLFLEEYAIDTLRLYAPVDGVEITCSPSIWSADEVFDNIQEAVEENTQLLKVRDRAIASKPEEEYFIVDVSAGNDVKFINSKDWANSLEVAPSDGSILVANPVGNQPGLGMLGFCYVPYHFVYNIKYPVLIQVRKGEEIFQFPVAVAVQGNNPRQSLDATASDLENEICAYKNTPIEVRTYDTNLNSVDADVSFECFGAFCSIGKMQDGKLSADFPQCVNGYIITNAEGFEETKYMFSTTSAGSVDIIMNKLYEKNINLKIDGKSYNGNAIIYFISDAGTKTAVYPLQKSIKLAEGQYDVEVYIYKNSSLQLQKSTYEQCVDVPVLGGVFGLKKKQCVNVEIPSQVISNVLAGGGKQEYYIIESELTGVSAVEINAQSLPTPNSVFELQDNYVLFETKGLEIKF